MNPTAPADTARIARLFIYPVKSCAGIELQEAIVTDTGLEFDRAWAVVDEDGEFLSQREHPRMALIQPRMRHSDMVLRAPGMLALHAGLHAVEEPMRARVWDDVVQAYDMGAVAAQWFSDFLGVRARLVRFDPEYRRLAEMKWTAGREVITQFADGFPLLLASEASLAHLNERLAAAGRAPVGMERFRPNIVLAGLDAHAEDGLVRLVVPGAHGDIDIRPCKPCGRCQIPEVDPASGVPGSGVLSALAGYRREPRIGGAVAFGMNAFVAAGAEDTLRVGQAVRCDAHLQSGPPAAAPAP